jgi:hypothetical protein
MAAALLVSQNETSRDAADGDYPPEIFLRNKAVAIIRKVSLQTHRERGSHRRCFKIFVTNKAVAGLLETNNLRQEDADEARLCATDNYEL